MNSRWKPQTDAPFQSQGAAICNTLGKALGASKTNADSVRRLLSTVSLLIRVSPLNALAPVLVEAGIFQHIVSSLEDDKASGLILASYLEILSRIALADANGFLQVVAEAARRQGMDGQKMLEQILDALWRNFDYVGEARMRKAVAMAAGSLLTTVSTDGVWQRTVLRSHAGEHTNTRKAGWRVQ